ncbi:MAG: 2-amino-4-hydroxy-6-hydroxymethyldihydropteridine diphosphokinase [Muribaculaceae bacterium]|nr:2-amino-4-hydroxy-6-hydroxymethyldihydropteridine diphosphokinase [Muribaculaceae bacterium]
MRLHLNIGSNSGNRHARIRAAVAALSSFFSEIGGRMALSAPVRSEPWGFESPNKFINIGLMVDLPQEASADFLLRILARVQTIEKSISPASHRNADGSYRDREIDIDLIDAGIRMHTPELTLPHPRAAERPFVIGPMQELEGR